MTMTLGEREMALAISTSCISATLSERINAAGRMRMERASNSAWHSRRIRCRSTTYRKPKVRWRSSRPR